MARFRPPRHHKSLRISFVSGESGTSQFVHFRMASITAPAKKNRVPPTNPGGQNATINFVPALLAPQIKMVRNSVTTIAPFDFFPNTRPVSLPLQREATAISITRFDYAFCNRPNTTKLNDADLMPHRNAPSTISRIMKPTMAKFTVSSHKINAPQLVPGMPYKSAQTNRI